MDVSPEHHFTVRVLIKSGSPSKRRDSRRRPATSWAVTVCRRGPHGKSVSQLLLTKPDPFDLDLSSIPQFTVLQAESTTLMSYPVMFS